MAESFIDMEEKLKAQLPDRLVQITIEVPDILKKKRYKLHYLYILRGE